MTTMADPDVLAEVLEERYRGYPYDDGPFTVLGPGIFTDRDGRVICWKGRNYVPQPERLSKLDWLMLSPFVLGVLCLLTAAFVAGQGC